jgi:hypothetical protein
MDSTYLLKGVEREWLPALADFRENFFREKFTQLIYLTKLS